MYTFTQPQIKHIIYRLVEQRKSFEITNIGNEADLDALFQYLRLNSPILFHLGEIHYTGSLFNKSYVIHPQYTMNSQEYHNNLEAIKQSVGRLKRHLNSIPSLFDKELYIHDMLCSTISYQDIGATGHTVIGPLLEKRGVCDGISKTAKLLLQNCGFDAFVISGYTGKAEHREPHAWNIVRLPNSYYHLDVTFDLNISANGTRYDYFNLPTKKILADHLISFDYENLSPFCCSTEYYYYSFKGDTLQTIAEMKNFFTYKLSEKSNFFQFSFLLSPSISSAEDVDQIFQQVAKRSNDSLSYEYSYNENYSIMAYSVTYA